MQLAFDFPIHTQYGFDNFVICNGNRTAYQFTRKVADPAEADNLLYLYGPSGAGKTHLLVSLSRALADAAGHDQLPFFSFRELPLLYPGNIPSETASRLAELFRDAPHLVLDDIHLVPDDDRLRIELWQLFNDFYTAGKKIAIAGLHPPKDLAALDEHLISRLLWGLVARVDVSDDDSRRMIMKKLAEDRQMILPAEVIDYLLVHVRREIPALITALEAIRRLALAAQRKVTIRLAREALEQAG